MAITGRIYAPMMTDDPPIVSDWALGMIDAVRDWALGAYTDAELLAILADLLMRDVTGEPEIE